MGLELIRRKLSELNISGYELKKCTICRALLYSMHDTCSQCYKNICDRSKCHAAGLAVYTTIDRQKYVLMGRCSKHSDADRSRLLEFIGGVAAADNETPMETATRELWEETLETIDIRNRPLEFLGGHNNANGNGYILYGYYIPFHKLQQAIQQFDEKARGRGDLEIDMLVLAKYDDLRRAPKNQCSPVSIRRQNQLVEMSIGKFAAMLSRLLPYSAI